jgi:hypothetical protein
MENENIENNENTIPLEERYKKVLAINLKLRNEIKDAKHQLDEQQRIYWSATGGLEKEIAFLKKTMTSILEVTKIKLNNQE